MRHKTDGAQNRDQQRQTRRQGHRRRVVGVFERHAATSEPSGGGSAHKRAGGGMGDREQPQIKASGSLEVREDPGVVTVGQ